MADELEALFGQLSINEDTVGAVDRGMLDEVLGATEMLRAGATAAPSRIFGGGFFGSNNNATNNSSNNNNKFSDPAAIHQRQVEGMRRLRKCLSVTPPPIDAVLDTGIWSLATYFLDAKVPHNTPTMVYEASWVVLNLLSGSEEQVSKVVFNTTAIHSLKELLLAKEVPIASREHAAWAIGNIMGTNHFFRMILVDEHRIVPALLSFLYDVKECFQHMTRAAARERHEAVEMGLMGTALEACQRGYGGVSNNGGENNNNPIQYAPLSPAVAARFYTGGTSTCEGKGAFHEHEQHHRADAMTSNQPSSATGGGGGGGHSTILSSSEVKVLQFHFSHHWSMLLEQCRFQTVAAMESGGNAATAAGGGGGGMMGAPSHSTAASYASVVLDGIQTSSTAYQRTASSILSRANARGGGGSSTMYDFGMGIPADSDALAEGNASSYLQHGGGGGGGMGTPYGSAATDGAGGGMGSPAASSSVVHIAFSGPTRLVSVRWLLLTALRNGLWSLANTVRPMTMPAYSQQFYDALLSSPQQQKFIAEQRQKIMQQQQQQQQQQQASPIVVESAANAAQRVHHRYALAANLVTPSAEEIAAAEAANGGGGEDNGGSSSAASSYMRFLVEDVQRRAETVKHTPPLAYVRIAFPCFADFINIPDAEAQKEAGWAIEFSVMTLLEACKGFAKSDNGYLPCPVAAYTFDQEQVAREEGAGDGSSRCRWWALPSGSSSSSAAGGSDSVASVPFRAIHLMVEEGDAEVHSTGSLPWPLGMASQTRLFDTLNQCVYATMAANRNSAAANNTATNAAMSTADLPILFDRVCVEVCASDPLFIKAKQSRSFGATVEEYQRQSMLARQQEAEERNYAALYGWDEGTSFLFSSFSEQQQQQQQLLLSSPPLFSPRVEPSWRVTTPYYLLNESAVGPASAASGGGGGAAAQLSLRSDEEILSAYLYQDLRIPVVLQSHLYRFVHASNYCDCVEWLRRLVLACPPPPSSLSPPSAASTSAATPTRFIPQTALYAFSERLRSVTADPFIIGNDSSNASVDALQLLTMQARLFDPAIRLAPSRVLLQFASVFDRRYDYGYSLSLRRASRLLRIILEAGKAQTTVSFEHFLQLSEVIVRSAEEEEEAMRKAVEDGDLMSPLSNYLTKAQAHKGLQDAKYNEIMLARLSAEVDTPAYLQQQNNSTSSSSPPPAEAVAMSRRGNPLATSMGDDRLPLVSFLYSHPTGIAATALLTTDFYWHVQSMRVALASSLGTMADALASRVGAAIVASTVVVPGAVGVVEGAPVGSSEAAQQRGKEREQQICDGFAHCFDFPSPTPQMLTHRDDMRTMLLANPPTISVNGGGGAFGRTDGRPVVNENAVAAAAQPFNFSEFTVYSPSEKMSIFLAASERSLKLNDSAFYAALTNGFDLFNTMLKHTVPLCAHAQIGTGGGGSGGGGAAATANTSSPLFASNSLGEHAADVLHYQERCLPDFTTEAATGYGYYYNVTVAQNLGLVGLGGGGGGGLGVGAAVSPLSAWYGLVGDLMRITQHWYVPEVPFNLTTAGGIALASAASASSSSEFPLLVPVDQQTFQRFLATALFVSPTRETVLVGGPTAEQQQQHLLEQQASAAGGGEVNLTSIAAEGGESHQSIFNAHLHSADSIGLVNTHSQFLLEVLCGGIGLLSNLSASALPLLLMTRCSGGGGGTADGGDASSSAAAAYGGLFAQVGPVAAYCVTLLERAQLKGWEGVVHASGLASSSSSSSSAAATVGSLLTAPQPLSAVFLHFFTDLPKFVELIVIRGIQGIEERSPGLIGEGLARREAEVQRVTQHRDHLKSELKRMAPVVAEGLAAVASGGGDPTALYHQQVSMQQMEEALAEAEQHLGLLDDEGDIPNYHRFGIPVEYSRLMSVLRRVFSFVLEASRQLEVWCKRRAGFGAGPNTVDWSSSSSASTSASTGGEELGGAVLTVQLTMLGRKGYVDADGVWWSAVPPSWTRADPTTGAVVPTVPHTVAAFVDGTGVSVPWVPLLVADPQQSVGAEAACVGTHPPSKETFAGYGAAALRSVDNANTTNAKLGSRSQHPTADPTSPAVAPPLLPMTPLELAAATTSRNIPITISTAHVTRLMTLIGGFAAYLQQLTYVPVYGATAALGQLVMGQAQLTLAAVQNL